MYRKFSQGWFKHFDFIVIDLLCVQFSFFAAAFWRHGGFPYYDKIYVNTAILLFFIDVLTCIFFSTYANVLRRGYLKEFRSTFLHTCEVSVGVLVVLYLMKDAYNLSRLVYVVFHSSLFRSGISVQDRLEEICAALSQRKRNPFFRDRYLFLYGGEGRADDQGNRTSTKSGLVGMWW